MRKPRILTIGEVNAELVDLIISTFDKGLGL
jgi:hypothetical protein